MSGSATTEVQRRLKRGISHLRMGRYTDAIHASLEGLALSRRSHDFRGESACLLLLARCLEKSGYPHCSERIREASPE